MIEISRNAMTVIVIKTVIIMVVKLLVTIAVIIMTARVIIIITREARPLTSQIGVCQPQHASRWSWEMRYPFDWKIMLLFALAANTE